MSGFDPPFPTVSGVVRVEGLELAYERAGEGPPIVFAHGAACDARTWRPQLASLSDEFTVVAWDEPGAGRSSDVPAGFSLGDFADCPAGRTEAPGLDPRTSPASRGAAPSRWSCTGTTPNASR